MTSGCGLSLLRASELAFRFLDSLPCLVFCGDLRRHGSQGAVPFSAGWAPTAHPLEASAPSARTRAALARPGLRHKPAGAGAMAKELRGRFGLAISFPCQMCSSLATDMCGGCGNWTCDEHLTCMYDEYWCCLCYLLRKR